MVGPRAWNTLPDVIRRCSSPDDFKRSLKTHLYILSYFNAIIGSCFLVTSVECPQSDFYSRHGTLNVFYITYR